MKDNKIILLGPTPPPFIGPSVGTKIILKSKLRERFKLIHLDTSDHRGLNRLAAVDFTNIFLAFKHHLQLFGLILKERPALVYVPLSQTTLGYLRDSGFILISKLFGRKVICHLRGGNFGDWYESAGRLTRFYVRMVHSLVDGQIVLGNKLKSMFAGLLPPKKIFVVPNGRDFETFNQDRKNEVIRILYLSNLIRSKGILDALAAAADVCRDHPQVEFVFAGEWCDKRTKMEILHFLEENNSLPIRCMGPVTGEDKYRLFASSDLFVYPTYYKAEGHPWVIIEALAHGLPVISTDQGAITESVIDGLNGFIIDKLNPGQIAEKVILLVKSPDLRERMGKESRKMYLQNFTEKSFVEKMSVAFTQVLKD